MDKDSFVKSTFKTVDGTGLLRDLVRDAIVMLLSGDFDGLTAGKAVTLAGSVVGAMVFIYAFDKLGGKLIDVE